MLPETLRPWFQDCAERLQVPLEFLAVPATVSLGSLLGRSVVIRPKKLDHWTVIPKLWGCIVGRPSTMKSPAMKEALGILDCLVKGAYAEWEEVRYLGEAETEADKAKLEGLRQTMKSASRSDKGSDLQTLLGPES